MAWKSLGYEPLPNPRPEVVIGSSHASAQRIKCTKEVDDSVRRKVSI
jgi:hypothetical protein